MPSGRASSAFNTGMRLPIRENQISLPPEEMERLRLLLEYKLRQIPQDHIPRITVADILHRTQRTHIPNVPRDINLAFLLRNYALIEAYNCVPQKEDSGQDEAIARAIWFYRLDTNHQFQRYQNNIRWNITLFTSLITLHSLIQQTKKQDIYQSKEGTRRSQHSPTFSPAALQFMKLYLAAVMEAHAHPTIFTAREAFIRFWRVSPLELFNVKTWAQRAIGRRVKELSPEWDLELRRAWQVMGNDAYEAKVAPFVGCLIPGQAIRTPSLQGSAMGRYDETNAGYGKSEQNELLDALMVPCPTAAWGKSHGAVKQSEDGEFVCDLRAATSCLQSVRPKEILPVLMDIFSPAHD